MDTVVLSVFACTFSEGVLFKKCSSFSHFAWGLGGSGEERHGDGERSCDLVDGEFRIWALSAVMDTTLLRSAPMGGTAFVWSEALRGCEPRAKDNDTEP